VSELLRLTLVELRDLLVRKAASPVELMKQTLDRIDATHQRLNAVVSRRDPEQLFAEARAAEQRIVRGEGRPLEGIPLGVKDLEDAGGLITSHGSLPFREHVAQSDSTQVARLRAAGAIVLGKTNSPEFGYTAITKNLIYGVTRSPWDRERTPGGSSGGSAAAMAGELLPLVTASDGGGSIRIPASFTGCFGLKPSYGRVPRGPFEHWDHGMTSVYGPLTKTVGDAALVLDQVAGHSHWDPTSLPTPDRPYASAVERPLERKLNVACSMDLGYAVVQSDVAAAAEEAFTVFERLGHRVKPVSGGPPELGAHWGLLGAYEIAAKISHLLPERESEFMKSLMDGVRMATDITPRWWGDMSKKRAALVAWCAELFSEYDLLLTPTVPYDPPPAKGPFPEQTEGRQQSIASVAAFTIPFNLAWNPAASVRMGLSKAGLPMGLQIVGAHHRDDLVLQAARAFERERPWDPNWPMR
jgi:aspartyl-tRNA(Asn)/glutamyl-tRNA(Gln) amidotransferase subunit A